MRHLVLSLATLILFSCLAITAQAANPTALSWESPTTNTDGSALVDLDGFITYCGTSSGSYSNVQDVGMVNSVFVNTLGLGNGKWYCAVTAYDTSSNESAQSNEVFFTLDYTKPNPPINLKAE